MKEEQIEYVSKTVRKGIECPHCKEQVPVRFVLCADGICEVKGKHKCRKKE